MAKIKYDVSDVEVQEDRDFSTPVPVGVYTVRLIECDETTSSNDNPMIACTLEIVGGEFDGRYLWDNVVLIDSTEWKLAQFIRALQLKDSGSLDTTKVIGTLLKARVKHENSKEYGLQGKVAALLPMPDDEDADEDADEEEEESSTDDDEDDTSGDSSDDEDDDDDEVPPYDEWNLTELSAEVRERGMEIKTQKKGDAKKKYLIQKLEKDDEKDNDGDEPF